VIEHLTEADFAAEAEMVRTTFTGTILFLEGSSDLLLFEKFIDTNNCYVLIAYGKDNVIGAVQILESKQTKGILGIVDADHWNITNRVSPSTNILPTDVHDLELLIIQSDAFQRVINEYASQQKIKGFLRKHNADDLRSEMLERCVPIGMLRLISLEENLSLKFKGLKYKGLIEASSLKFDVTKLVNAVVNNTSQQGVNPNDILIKLKVRLVKVEHDRFQLCSGHDVIEILGIGLRKVIGSQVEAIACRENLESVLRLAYEMRHFNVTRLYSLIKQWETRNAPFLVLLPLQ
jgi:Protein of unknown function (DUF4435)